MIGFSLRLSTYSRRLGSFDLMTLVSPWIFFGTFWHFTDSIERFDPTSEHLRVVIDDRGGRGGYDGRDGREDRWRRSDRIRGN
jgi:hypothetical protein